jgi:hypothetical protein
VAEAKEAELNARVLQLESKLHWLQQGKQQLEAQLAAAAQAPEQQQAVQGQQKTAEGQVQRAGSRFTLLICLCNLLE